MEEIVGAGEVLLLSECGGRVTEVRCVIVSESATKLARRPACECDTHSQHRLHRRCFHAEQPHAPTRECMCVSGTRSSLCRNQFVPHRPCRRMEDPTPFLFESVRIKKAMCLQQLLARHVRRKLQVSSSHRCVDTV